MALNHCLGSSVRARRHSGYGQDDPCKRHHIHDAKTPELQDMDLFYYRQLAASLPDQELQDKMDHEIRMREGTAKLLAASRHPQQMLEAAKSLLTCNSRIMGYMSELQRRKTDQVLRRKSKEDGNQLPCKARLSVSDIRIPLMWKDTDHFKNKGDHSRYAVFCMVKIGSDIQDTVLLGDVDRSMTDLTFDEPIVFDDIQPNFECIVEVYCHKLYDDLTMASTPKKIKKKFNDIGNSVGRSVGRRLSGIKDDPEFTGTVLVGPKFDSIAHGTVGLADISDSVLTHKLVLENPSHSTFSTAEAISSELPLYDNFCCRLSAQPHCLTDQTTTGVLRVQQQNNGPSEECWCCLQNLQIRCWPCQKDANIQPPSITIPVTKETQISKVCDPPHSLALQQLHDDAQVISLVAPTEKEITQWWEGLQQHLLDQVMWQHTCDKLMDIKPSTPRRPSSMMQLGPVNLHAFSTVDDSECDSPMTRILNRLNVDGESQEVQPFTRSTRARRSLASSSSREIMAQVIKPGRSSCRKQISPEFNVSEKAHKSQSFSNPINVPKQSSLETDV